MFRSVRRFVFRPVPMVAFVLSVFMIFRFR